MHHIIFKLTFVHLFIISSIQFFITISLMIFPLSFIMISIEPIQFSLSIKYTIFNFSKILTSIFKNILSFSCHLIIQKLSFIYLIWPKHFSVTVFLRFYKVSFINFFCFMKHFSISFKISILKISNTNYSIPTIRSDAIYL